MKNPPTYEDAELILRLFDLRREPRLREARKWMAGVGVIASRQQFLALCPVGTEENASYRMVTTYWDMAASFVAQGVLHRELFYRSNNLELLRVWVQVKGMIEELRAANRNPLLLRNIEDVALGFIEYLELHAPGFYETWAANIARSAPTPATR